MQNVRLPYINNTKAVLVTVTINLGVVFLFYWPDGVTYQDVLWDSLLCAALTVFIDICIILSSMKKMRTAGEMPANVPVSRLMQRLPQNPFALGAVYVVVFGALTVGVNALLLRFFDMMNMAFWAWMAYKLVYATILSVKITEYCIFRYVQPDWANAAGKNEGWKHTAPGPLVKNPLPKISVFKEVYGSITGNIALNIIIGSALGGVVIGPGGSVVIYPTTLQSIPITGLIFGFICGALVANGTVNGVNAALLASGADPKAVEKMVADKCYAWLPKGKIALLGVVCACTMAFSAVALPAAMLLFDISAMNFYQFTVVITLYAAIISKPLSFAVTKRCMQPDYILHLLKKAKGPE